MSLSGPVIGAVAVGVVLAVAVSNAVARPPPGGPDAGCGAAPKKVPELGRRFDFGAGSVLKHQTPMRAVDSPSPVRTAYVRALLEATNLGSDRAWRVVVRDEALRPLQTITAAQFEEDRTRWTMRIPGSRGRVELRGVKAGSTVAVKLVEGIQMPDSDERAYYSVKDPNRPGFRPLYDGGVSEKHRRLGDHAALLIGTAWHGMGTARTWCCSGAIVAPDLLLTNWHCGAPPEYPVNGFWSPEICDELLVDVSFDDDGHSAEFGCKRVVARDREMDFALIELRPLGDRFGTEVAPLARARPAAGAPLFVISHPACRPKQYSPGSMTQPRLPLPDGGWATADFGHDVDTESGSSGAPVFNEAGEIVGIHHLGYDVDPVTCEKDWTNKAIWIDAITQRLADAGIAWSP